MIRRLVPTDYVRLASMNGTDWAVVPGGGVGGLQPTFSLPSFLWERSRLRQRSGAWISTSGGRVRGVASARRCAGPTVWVVDHLVLGPTGSEESAAELLECAAVYAGSRGAQRIFLRTPEDWHMLETGRRCGFLPCTQATVHALAGRTPLIGVEAMGEVRPRLPGDDIALFRLYNRCTPSEVRSAVGMTLQEWQDAQEPVGRSTREFVLEDETEIAAWIRLDRSRGRMRVQAMLAPEWEGDSHSLVAFILGETRNRPVLWNVPYYQIGMRMLLERVGLEQVASYSMMVKPMAVRVREPVLGQAASAD
jgi:hypothetical protein